MSNERTCPKCAWKGNVFRVYNVWECPGCAELHRDTTTEAPEKPSPISSTEFACSAKDLAQAIIERREKIAFVDKYDNVYELDSIVNCVADDSLLVKMRKV